MEYTCLSLEKLLCVGSRFPSIGKRKRNRKGKLVWLCHSSILLCLFWFIHSFSIIFLALVNAESSVGRSHLLLLICDFAGERPSQNFFSLDHFGSVQYFSLYVSVYLSPGRIYAAPESRHRHAMPVCPSSRRNRGSSPRRRETNRRTWAPVVRAEGDDKCTRSAEDGTLVKETLKCSHLTNKRCMAYTRRLQLKEGGRHTTSTTSLQAFQ